MSIKILLSVFVLLKEERNRPKGSCPFIGHYRRYFYYSYAYSKLSKKTVTMKEAGSKKSLIALSKEEQY
ncbi:hypothetical protein RIR_jg4291.t2 [Rhizophagus irregularis DAOM 181602=DAOM 197198]|nr:hypothetical protein RIR_jg4291.t2 [Rhizophagus irregularis DAOM 181602=DAOM 197198]